MSLDSPPLVRHNTVEFVFLSQGVWLLWAFLFCPWGSPPTKMDFGKQLGGQTNPVGSLPLVCYNPSESVFLSQSIWLPSAYLCWLTGSAPTKKNFVWGAVRGQKWYCRIAPLWFAKTSQRSSDYLKPFSSFSLHHFVTYVRTYGHTRNLASIMATLRYILRLAHKNWWTTKLQ